MQLQTYHQLNSFDKLYEEYKETIKEVQAEVHDGASGFDLGSTRLFKQGLDMARSGATAMFHSLFPSENDKKTGEFEGE